MDLSFFLVLFLFSFCHHCLLSISGSDQKHLLFHLSNFYLGFSRSTHPLQSYPPQRSGNLNCTFCHRYVERYRVAGIPNIELCRACHSTDAMSKRPEALKWSNMYKQGKKIPWQRMYELPEFVVFPHWIHIQNGVDCSVCHGLTGMKERPVKMVDRDYMEWCVDCHKKRGAISIATPATPAKSHRCDRA